MSFIKVLHFLKIKFRPSLNLHKNGSLILMYLLAETIVILRLLKNLLKIFQRFYR